MLQKFSGEKKKAQKQAPQAVSCKWRYIPKQHSQEAWFISVGKAHRDISSGSCVGLELLIAFYSSAQKSCMTEYQILGIGSPLFGCKASKLHD